MGFSFGDIFNPIKDVAGKVVGVASGAIGEVANVGSGIIGGVTGIGTSGSSRKKGGGEMITPNRGFGEARGNEGFVVPSYGGSRSIEQTSQISSGGSSMMIYVIIAAVIALVAMFFIMRK